MRKVVSARDILNDDWGDYDYNKIVNRQSRRYFDCSNEWEVAFLKKLIKKYFPLQTDNAIQKAIMSSEQTLKVQVLRKVFVEYVVGNL